MYLVLCVLFIRLFLSFFNLFIFCVVVVQNYSLRLDYESRGNEIETNRICTAQPKALGAPVISTVARVDWWLLFWCSVVANKLFAKAVGNGCVALMKYLAI